MMWWYSQSCNIHYPLRWRIRHHINLNNICKVVSSQRVSLNAGQKGSAPHGLLPYRRLRSSRPCFVCNHKQYKMLEWKWSSFRCVGECDCLGTHNTIQPRARPSNSTSTPRRRDGFLLLCTFFAQVVEGSVFPWGTHVLPTTWWVVIYFSVSAGRVGVSPVFVKVDFHWRVFGYRR